MKVGWEYKEDPETVGSPRPYESCAHRAVSCYGKTWWWKRARTKMTASERGRSIAPTCQNVLLEFKCILFNRWTRPGRSKLWVFFPRVCSSSRLSPLCSTIPILLRILVNYMRFPLAHRSSWFDFAPSVPVLSV